MPKSASSWSFAKTARICRKAVRDSDKIESIKGLFSEWIVQNPDSPVITASEPRRTVGDIWIWSALATAEKDPRMALRYFHLAWRSQVLFNSVYLHHARMLAADAEKMSSRKRLACKSISPIDLAELTMLAAASFALREQEVGHWIFSELIRVLSKPEQYVERDAIAEGSVGAYLLRLYSLWMPGTEIEALLAPLDPEVFGPYGAIFNDWNGDDRMAEHVDRLADLHAYKLVNHTYPNLDKIYCLSGWLSEFPAEILFLNIVREKTGLKMIPCDHAMTRNPLALVPTEDFSSGYDEYLARAISKLRSDGFETDQIPWEFRFQALGPTDPKRLYIPQI